MKSLVTGGTGFVGSHLIEDLRSRGDDVRAIVRSDSKRSQVESFGAQSVLADLDELDSLRRACQDREVVYHSAARVEIVGTEEEFQKTTVEGTARLLDAASEAGVKRFVHVSSCGVYHPKLFAGGEILDEFTPTPMPPHWFPYGRAKLRAEEIVRSQCPPEMEWVIVRLGYLYGPRNRTMKTHVEPALRDSTMAIVGSGANEMAFTYVKDAVRAIALAGSAPAAARQILIAAGDEHVTQREYFDAMADGLGIPRVKKHIPYWAAFFFGWLGEYVIRKGPRQAAIRRASIALTGL
ncbi:MAG TPA: NAD-dependent epimerase/dehydratase family protein, partial [Phycisphaerae bacterium]|nr:NAD-dependent epimerase/dehydratase family protein [Phycisphaerae bacterium]